MPVTPPTITERLIKQQPLTASEMDTNLSGLKSYTTDVETSYSGGTGVIDGTCVTSLTLPVGSINPTGSTSGQIFTSAGPAATPTWTAAPESFLTGMMMDWCVSATPSGWLACDGAAISRTTYADLFTAIGTNFGVGDGSTTFNVPNANGRMRVGVGQALDSKWDATLNSGAGGYGPGTTRAMNDSGGQEDHKITIAELAAHTHHGEHNIANSTHANGGGYAGQGGNSASSSTGGDDPHENMPPWIAIPVYIKI